MELDKQRAMAQHPSGRGAAAQATAAPSPNSEPSSVASTEFLRSLEGLRCAEESFGGGSREAGAARSRVQTARATVISSLPPE